MGNTREETALATREEQYDEMVVATASARVQHEIQASIAIAKKFPRDEDAAYQKLFRACKRTSFADTVAYSFPRGKDEDGNRKMVTGPSINLAREAARVWGNVRYGYEVTKDNDEERTIRAFAWDVETNTKVEAEDNFEKLIQRKLRGETVWLKPDERDLRELTGRRGAVAVRNCILQILPRDLVEDALAIAAETRQSEAQRDPDAARKRILDGFDEINVTAGMLEEYLGHPLAQSSPVEIARLREIWKSIADGNSTWAEYMASRQPQTASAATLASPVVPQSTDVKAVTEEKAAQMATKYAAPPPQEKVSDPSVATESKAQSPEPEARAASRQSHRSARPSAPQSRTPQGQSPNFGAPAGGEDENF